MLYDNIYTETKIYDRKISRRIRWELLKKSHRFAAGKLPCLTKAVPSLLAREHALTWRTAACIRVQPVARFASQCTCSTAGEVQRRWTGPPPTPISSNHTGRVTTRAESVGVHANLSRPCTSFRCVYVSYVSYSSTRIYARAACCWCASFPPAWMQHSYRFAARKPQFAASRGAMHSRLHCVVPRACHTLAAQKATTHPVFPEKFAVKSGEEFFYVEF